MKCTNSYGFVVQKGGGFVEEYPPLGASCSKPEQSCNVRAGLYVKVGLEPESDGLEGGIVGGQRKVGRAVAVEVDGVSVHSRDERCGAERSAESDVMAVAAGVEDQFVRRVGLELVVGEEAVLGLGGN